MASLLACGATPRCASGASCSGGRSTACCRRTVGVRSVRAFASTTTTSSTSTTSTSTSSSTSYAVGRRAALAAACAALTLAHAQLQPGAADAKPGLFDLPACSKFKQAGALQYCDVQVGSGDSPAEGDLIVVDYTARATATGQVYDSSRNFKFTLGQSEVIPGWEQGLLGLGPELPPIKAGGTRTLLVPPELAYGAQGDGCLFGRPESCRVPGNSPVEISFKFQGLGY